MNTVSGRICNDVDMTSFMVSSQCLHWKDRKMTRYLEQTFKFSTTQMQIKSITALSRLAW